MKKINLKNPNLYLVLGIIIYAITLIIDRFVLSIPDFIYIIIMLIVIALFIVNIVFNKK